MKESALRTKIRLKLQEEFGGFWVVIHGGPYQMVGLPDIVGCLMGHFVGIEVKLPGKEKTLTARQMRVIELIRAAGGTAGMVTTVDQAFTLVRRGS